MKHLGTIQLETDRLVLRRFTVNDAESVFNNWASDDEVTKYLTWPTHKSKDVSRGFMDYCVIRGMILHFFETHFVSKRSDH